jgi:hypothetical protein
MTDDSKIDRARLFAEGIKIADKDRTDPGGDQEEQQARQRADTLYDELVADGAGLPFALSVLGFAMGRIVGELSAAAGRTDERFILMSSSLAAEQMANAARRRVREIKEKH